MIYENYPRCADKSPIIYGEYIARDFNVTFSDGNWHEDPEILIFTKGEGYVLLDSEKISVKPGAIVIANPYSIHNIGTQSMLSYYCIIVDKNFLPENGIALENFCIQSYITDEKLFKKCTRFMMFSAAQILSEYQNYVYFYLKVSCICSKSITLISHSRVLSGQKKRSNKQFCTSTQILPII